MNIRPDRSEAPEYYFTYPSFEQDVAICSASVI